MIYIILAIVSMSVALVEGVVFAVVMKKSKTNSGSNKDVEALLNAQKNETSIFYNTLVQAQKSSEITMQNMVNNLSVAERREFDNISKRVDELTVRNQDRIERLTLQVNNALSQMREENDKAIEKMRETVDEKLNNTLSQRLNDSFVKIQQSLESVNLGIGEMRNLANGVGDIKKVLSNVKVRGGWGEVMLSSLLEQMLAPNQYMAQVQVKKNSRERVDFAVIMPGKDEKGILLPIDSKFPLEDYNRLVEASESLNKDIIETSRKQLMKRIKDEAKSIHEKYIQVPETTDFAIMFLPIEGLYAEVVRDIDLMDTLQSQYKIVVCGPTTLTALLNSLQLGFKTMSIEKRSSELWQILSTFKNEFEKFVQLLLKTQAKLGEANSNIEMATKSSRKIAKKLGDVSQVVGIDYEDDDNGGEADGGELPFVE